ncbi:MAG: RNA methyltransferase [Trueperaceae bacterium]|nr:RNA methyltransferase [Trueperaceae bacterium]
MRPKLDDNVGAAARAMKNFGLSELVLVAPRCGVGRQAYALASHAGDVLDAARTTATLGEALGDVRWAIGTSARVRADGAPEPAGPDEGLATLPAGGGALVFGPEDHGLANEDLDQCQAVVRIPTAAYASINLAQAVNLLAYRWFALHGADTVPQGDPEPAARDQVERMYAQLVSLWHLIGYTDAARERATLRLFRNIFDRAALRPREVAALRGLWSQAAWAAERDPGRLPGRNAAGNDTR